MLYLDYAATTPPYDEVVDTMSEVMKKHYGNPSSLHKLGVEAEQLVSQARAVIAKSMRCRPEEIIITSGGTESNNLAIQGAVRRFRHRGNHIITSVVEHASVYDTCRALERQGCRVTYLPVDATGAVKLEDLELALTEDTILVSVMAVNNETGRIQPIEQIADLLKRLQSKALFHVDAVQAVCKLPMNLAIQRIDLLSCSAHKMRGPKGIGFLYCRQNLELEPLLWGGGQESGIRSGTQNVPAIVGMAKAMRIATDHQEQFYEHTAHLRQRFIEGINDIPELVLNASVHPMDMVPYILHFSFPGMRSEVLLHALEQHGIYVSTGSACSSGAIQPSRVLKAMGYEDNRATSGIRISYSLDHTREDADYFCRILKQVVDQLKQTSTLTSQRRRR
ncbi:aminotransferase class V-fold PLP-dependent enzyme [Paenibacillus sp. LMG 31456]|uniref:Aminotransferase class V-fold PLP-dependent enzyme n=1 Tax=Paenibacillus foliorum TaxID=2654974 RepID=A0A972K310_9BACL|nr:cysteine desulfurase family protein [Paenibacillus foliorum]NOU95438.1 aminotransferase class V-fold PLP-dependent enzyme [Paenibacillus foliorum]